MAKVRLDVLVHERELAESREQAQRLIRAGEVMVNGQRATKPSEKVAETVICELRERPRFVSRGGDKLVAALDAFAVDVAGRTCLDVGASTGGFTDCLLQHGAVAVYAVDVGKGQLHWKLRTDPRVIVMEELNARVLDPSAFDPRPTLGTVDVSFISLTKVLPAIIQVLAAGSRLITLIKPQFEAGREFVEKGGVVRNEDVRRSVVDTIRRAGTDMGLSWRGHMDSPLAGPAGNVEILADWSIPAGA